VFKLFFVLLKRLRLMFSSRHRHCLVKVVTELDSVEVGVVGSDHGVALDLIDSALLLGQLFKQDHLVSRFKPFAADLGELRLQCLVL